MPPPSVPSAVSPPPSARPSPERRIARYSESPVQQQLLDNTAEERLPLAMLPALHRLVEPGHRSPPPHRSRTVSPCSSSSLRLRAASPECDTRGATRHRSTTDCMRKRRVRADYYAFLLAHGVQISDENDVNTTTSHHQDLYRQTSPIYRRKAREEARVDLFWRLVVAAQAHRLARRRTTPRNNSFNDCRGSLLAAPQGRARTSLWLVSDK